MEYLDKNSRKIVNGDIINLHQTVNGQNLFVIFDVSNLDVRYAHDLRYEYEYDKLDLLRPSNLTGETEYEIIGNIYDLITDVSS